MFNCKNDEVKRVIKNYILEDLLLGDCSFEIDDDTALINDNIIDSINLMELISFIERTMNITYSQEDYSIDNFNTINAIVDLVNKKMQESSLV
jgi:acyl carrier protein